MTTPEHDDQPTATQLHDARGWLLDCGFSDELVDDLTDRQVMRFVDLEYDGGWGAFLIDSTGHLVDRLITDASPSNSSDALVQWTVMLVKAHALVQLRPDQPAPSSNGTEL